MSLHVGKEARKWTHYPGKILCGIGDSAPITEIPFVNESSEQELLSLLGNWYEPNTYSVFSSIAFNAVFFSS